MKNNNWKIFLAIVIACMWGFTTFAQIAPARLQQFILDDKNISNADIKYALEVKGFYAHLHYKMAWLQKENTSNLNIFLNSLKLSSSIGLREKDYQFNYIGLFRNGTADLQNADDSLEAEIRFTDAAIHFYNDIAYGNVKPALSYNGLKDVLGCYNIAALLAENISKNSLHLLLIHLSSTLPEINALENKMKWFNTVMADSDFKEAAITSNKINVANKPLISKLYQLGIVDTANKNLSENTIKQKIKEAQQQFNLLADGVLRTTIIQELNVPLAARLQQLSLSINYYRWLHCLMQNQSVIVVNIPATCLKVYRNSNVVLEMRVIVGKNATPTPTLASTVNEVVLYPYWHVPYSIATKELLPALKRDAGYIDAGNYQVLNKAGKIVNPYSVNWHALSTNYFPYLIRQSTGCDNALGLLKLNFYSPFGVYLHDTPNKNLFMLNKRYFSHGCMRMEKPMELGHLVLKNNAIAIDTLEQKGCLRNQSPITVHADEHMPVIVWYNPAGIDSLGRVLFYEDVYKKFEWVKRK
jgi:murein L,D-transpeptidase YcbB/YkuD